MARGRCQVVVVRESERRKKKNLGEGKKGTDKV